MHRYFVVCATLVLAIFAGQRCDAQDPEMSQYFSAPLHLNPALAGISYGPKITLNYRNQWPGLGDGVNGGFVTYMVGYDQHIEALSGGIGLLLTSDRVAGDLLVANSAALMYSYQLRISRNFGFKIGLQGSYTHRYVDWFELKFSDQINTLTGFVDEFNIPNPTIEPVPDDFNLSYFDMGMGIVLFSNKHYGGVGIKHLLRPNESFHGDEDRLPVRIATHVGSVLPIGNGGLDAYFSPNALWVQQSDFTQINVGALFGVEFVYAGLWFRHTIHNADAVIGVVGFKNDMIRFGYSYDANISKLAGVSGGVHELSFSINFAGNDNSLFPSNHHGITECPDILNF